MERNQAEASRDNEEEPLTDSYMLLCLARILEGESQGFGYQPMFKYPECLTNNIMEESMPNENWHRITIFELEDDVLPETVPIEVYDESNKILGNVPINISDHPEIIEYPIIKDDTELGKIKVLLRIGSIDTVTECRDSIRSPQNGIGNTKNKSLQKTSDLLDILQRALTTPIKTTNASQEKSHPTKRVLITLDRAFNLPKCNLKIKKRGKRDKQKPRSERIEPSAYVTFASCEQSSNNYGVFPAKTGFVIATKVVHKTISPKWNQVFDVRIPSEYFTNPPQFFVFDVWRKPVPIESGQQKNLVPNPLTDLHIGACPLLLSNILLKTGQVEGHFQIFDSHHFNNENSSKSISLLKLSMQVLDESYNIGTTINIPSIDEENLPDLSELVNNKFTELQEISSRLKFRLDNVMSDEPTDDLDQLADEFERDLHTPPPEDDFFSLLQAPMAQIAENLKEISTALEQTTIDQQQVSAKKSKSSIN